eukprot:6192816-Pleurochrysis_carterae.AAC.1
MKDAQVWRSTQRRCGASAGLDTDTYESGICEELARHASVATCCTTLYKRTADYVGLHGINRRCWLVEEQSQLPIETRCKPRSKPKTNRTQRLSQSATQLETGINQGAARMQDDLQTDNCTGQEFADKVNTLIRDQNRYMQVP